MNTFESKPSPASEKPPQEISRQEQYTQAVKDIKEFIQKIDSFDTPAERSDFINHQSEDHLRQLEMQLYRIQLSMTDELLVKNIEELDDLKRLLEIFNTTQ